MDAIQIAVVTLAAVWGAATGLLIPRAAYRFSVEPEEEWRGACPAGHPFPGSGPSRGWLGAARCQVCTTSGTGVSATVPYAPQVLLPVVSALACALLAAATGTRPELAVWLLLTPVSVLLAAVDHRVHRLPDQLTLPLAGAAAVLLGVVSLLPEHDGSWTGSLLGGAALGAFYLVLYLINPNGMGFGDVKLALSLGVVLGWYGWPVLVAGGFAGFLFGAVYGLGLLMLRRANRRTGIPFGPFMIAGALTGVLLGAL
ncbi:A24 family peptidase [Streptomyces sp. NBC_00102]|uniref:prepilin peptidase n=1 Tax=Streptomyces sp. NBC_00102 TaxID=2975652 RepID=UPI00225B4AE4|nr:A24 family peptidase [Streptomyces sp. NBC_00102]MCX5399411.1 A24 family peptidase [Streptomyces sp. NBC_00102]